MKSDRTVLRFDRRMLGRRGWIAPEELEQTLAALPDASGKMAPPEEEGATTAEEPASSEG